MSQPRSQRLVIAGVALVLAAGAAYWGYGAYAKSQARKVAAALVKDTSQQLRAALLMEAAGPSTTASDAVARFEAQVIVVERNYASLRRLDTATMGALAAAADDYILTSQEILRRIAISSRSQFNLGTSTQALRSHMSADRGTATWPGEAVRLRERVNQDYREYRLAAATLVKLIDSLPASQDRIAAQLDPSVLIESQVIASAGAGIFKTSKRTAAEVEKLIDLAAYR